MMQKLTLFRCNRVNKYNKNLFVIKNKDFKNTFRQLAYSKKLGHGCNCSEKEQSNVKQKWTKMYKIWKYSKKGKVIACDNCT